jgi:NADH-quinone oxidoreductase subunit E
MSTSPTQNDTGNAGGLQDVMMNAANSFAPVDYRLAANLMAHPAAGMAVFSAIGFGIAGHMMGVFAGTMAGAAEASRKLPAAGSDISETMNAIIDLAESGMSASDSEMEDDTETVEAVTLMARSGGAAAVSHGSGPASESAPRPVKPVSARAAELMPEDFKQPTGMAKPDAADDLKRISGIGPKLEQVLNGLGIWSFAQVAGWTAEEIAWVDDYLQFKGRIERDDWIAQAGALAAGKDEAS